jgi:mannose/fructose/N-acetylgalactosamine-specific phosphotransferase system component IID
MGDFSGPATGCLRVVVIIGVILFLIIMGVTYKSAQSSGKDKGYEQGVKDALSGKVDSTILKK